MTLKPTENTASEETSNTHLREEFEKIFEEAHIEADYDISEPAWDFIQANYLPKSEALEQKVYQASEFAVQLANMEQRETVLKAELKEGVSKSEIKRILKNCYPEDTSTPCGMVVKSILQTLKNLLTEGHSPEVDKPNKK